ncbi:MAG: alkylphosphonate utilization protein [Flavobacteriales bacterium]|nr:alkylphosphonate utilization protein [Flavobacteriales bacterium]|tara:strand:+ start:1220 stop:1441 length:222 start_codon:yes stop_codon:yes gene_type:complete
MIKLMETKDSVGNVLNDGDTIIVAKTLKVKGMSKTLKRGDKIKNIRTIADPYNIECRVGKSQIVLKTCFVKKS